MRKETALYGRNIGVFASAIVFTFAGGLASIAANAQTARIETKVDFSVDSDRALTAKFEYRTTPLVQSAVGAAGQVRLQDTANASFEVIKAFTQKANGTIVSADRREFVTQNGAVGPAVSPGDVSIKQVPFRDVAVGDTTVLIARMTERQHYIARQFSRSFMLSPGPADQRLDVTLHSPADLDIRHDEQGLIYEESNADGRITRHWSGAVGPSTADEKQIADLPFVAPSLRFSTFPSDESIADAYYASATPKLAATPEIDLLASAITAGKSSVSDQVRAIFDWVAGNIRYVPVYFGRGALVPSDTHTILSRRFGDCKDHTVLTAALLAAKGIRSEQVLIGTDAIYRLPKTPVLQAFNHAIVYVPELDRYLDPSVAFGSFDHLPFGDAGKPVVRVSDQGIAITRTPALGVDDNTLTLETHLTITPDGRQHARTRVEARGEPADQLRAFAAQAEAKGKDASIANLANVRSLLGTSTLFATPWADAREPYVLTTTWDAQQPVDVVRAGWRAPLPLSPLLPDPNLFIGGLTSEMRTYPALCRAGRVVHNLELELPEGMVLQRLPSPVVQNAPGFLFHEQWSLDTTHVHVKTEITSTADRVCAPDQVDAVRAAYRAIAAKINPVLHFGWQSPLR
ncbi:MAG: transglutaminase-like domain-containing protein [Steroidobacteraceae bacterium]